MKPLEKRTENPLGASLPGEVESRRVDFYSAARSDEREVLIEAALGRLGELCARGQGGISLLWPRDRDLPYLAACLKMPLAHKVLSLLGECSQPVTLHTRNRQMNDFLSLAPDKRVGFVFHINTEEAAMRWERGEASPSQRLLAARQLHEAQWKVRICIGPLRVFPDWREEYLDVVQQVARSGFEGVNLSLTSPRGAAGEPMPSWALEESLSLRHQRQIQRLIATRLGIEPAWAEADFPN